MTVPSTERSSGAKATAASAGKFLIVGGTTVVIDAAAYWALSALGLQYDLAKALSFAIGAVFAYFANWRFTFGARRSRWSEVLFVVVYTAALGLNVVVNAGVRLLLPSDWSLTLPVAFVVATGVSAVWNFIGMSLFVFRGRTGQQKGESVE
ncbi:GtrA family protein [Cnuibacter sp. UC19_7]|uniref:GtrA family protein n=1 Tax=Cnuibacter sp. UC19_7 TaxID=3350166 RepID=UPI00366E3482